MVYFDNVIYILAFIPSVYVIERFGMRVALLVSLVCSVIGTWIALYGGKIGVKILGQFIIDAGFPFALSCLTKLPAAWFPMKERFYATSFIVLSGMIGYAMGESSEAVFNQEPLGFALTFTIVSVICVVLLPFFFYDKPSAPVSVSEQQKVGLPFNMMKEIKQLFGQTSFVFAALASSFYIT